MIVTKWNSTKSVTLSNSRYAIDWDNDGASKLEIKFRDLIYPFWKNYIVLFQARIPGSLYRIDFINVNKRLAVEVDGSQHNEFNAFFYQNSRNHYKEALKKDLAKENWCEENSITLLRLYKEDLDNFSKKYILEKFNIEI